MKLKKISIKHLRGIQNIEFLLDDFTTIIGKNNCGKSTVLRAIEMLCTNTKPDLEEFHCRDYETPIEIIGLFDDLKDWERNQQSISGLIYNNQLQLKYVANTVEVEGERRKVNAEYYAYKVNEVIDGWSDSWSSLSENIKGAAAVIEIDNAAKFRAKANKELVKQYIRENHPDLITTGDAEWSNDSITFNNALQQAIPKVVVIPAVKDATDESKFMKTGKTPFSELINKLILPQIKAEQHYIQILESVQALTAQMQGEESIEGVRFINEKLSDRLSRLINVKANLSLDNPEIDTAISSSVGLRIIDGEHDTPIRLQGYGLQRTLIFSLLELVAENENTLRTETARTTIVLYEEPELYLHPQMLRKLKEILKSISNTDNWQVVCSTHSPVFINVVDRPESLVIFSKGNDRVLHVKQLEESPFDEHSESGIIEKEALRAALNFHPTVCEAFFAENVILVEGDTEMAIFKHCDRLLTFCGVDRNMSLDIAIISCGGKWTIPALARLLKDFQIPFKIVHDIDAHGKTKEELKKVASIHPYKANERISALCNADQLFLNDDTIEDIWRDIWNGSKGGKPYSAIYAVNKMLDDENIPDKLTQLVKFVYADALIEI